MTALALRNGFGDYAPFSASRARRIDPNPALPPITDMKLPAWVEITQKQIGSIQLLEDTWDGYRAGPIRRDVVAYAIEVLNRIMRVKTPAAHITPMSHEGIMLEWHFKGIDLEVEIERPGSLWVSFEDSQAAKEYEVSLGSDLSVLQECIDYVTRRIGDSV